MFSQTENLPIIVCGSASTRGVFAVTSNGNFSNYASSLAASARQALQSRWRGSSVLGFDAEVVYLDNLRIPNLVDGEVGFASGFEAEDSGVSTPPG